MNIETAPVTGEIINIGEVRTFDSGFSVQEFVLRIEDGKYPQEVSFQLIKDGIERFSGNRIGDHITVYYNLRGRKGKNGDRWFNSLVAWRVERAEQPTNDPGEAYRRKAEQLDSQAAGDDEIPF